MTSRLALVLFFLAFCASAASGAEGLCRRLAHAGADYTACAVDPRKDRLELFDIDDGGRPYGSFAALSKGLSANGRSLVFAMNAGMYDFDQKPVGLYVERGRELKPVNRASGAGNFHLKPNGVFYVAHGKAGVMETDAYLAARIKPELATQSGPMLVIDGALHPKFLTGGSSLKMRNGVGVGADGKAIFAISEAPVSFHDFATLFRDELGARNALFLDGSVSSLFDATTGRDDARRPLGPIIAVVR